MKKHTPYYIAALCLLIAHNIICFKTHSDIQLDIKFLNLRKKIARTFYNCVQTKQKTNQQCLNLANSQLTELCNQHNKANENLCDTKIETSKGPFAIVKGLIAYRKFTQCFDETLKSKPGRFREYQNFFTALKVFIEKPNK